MDRARAAEHLVVISLDGLASADFETVQALPHFKKLFEEGSFCCRMRGVYPTQTYTLHASIITGTWPHRHGIVNNTRFQPGREKPDWFWYRRDIRVPTLYDLAVSAGLRTASLFWPTTGRSRIRYIIPEVITTGPGQSLLWRVLSAGSPLFVLDMARRFGRLLKGLDRSHLDDFTAAVACFLVRSQTPDLLLVHLLDLDATRHQEGFLAPQVDRVLEEEDRRLGQILEASRQAGTFESTAFIVFGDHAYLDVHTCIHLNTALRQGGLVSLDRGGRLVDWQAWANTCEGSAHIYLRDREDAALREKVLKVIQELKASPKTGIEEIYGGDQIQELKLGGGIDFVLEARSGFYFTPYLRSQVIEPAEPGHRANHGYHPGRDGYTSLFLAAGAGIRRAIELESMNVVDIGPTMASLLGLRLEQAEGQVQSSILE